MSDKILASLGLTAVMLSAGPATAQQFHREYDQPHGHTKAVTALGAPDKNASTETKRDWVREQMLQEFRAAGREREIDSAVAKMSPGRIDQLVEIYKKQPQRYEQEMLATARARLARSPAYRDYLRQQYQARRAGSRGRGVGFAPAITVLPEGASLAASAVVSPDRRYVRISAAPFFSSVTGLRTFNFHTGQSRTISPRRPHRPRHVGW